MIGQLTSLLKQAAQTGKRSTVLQPMQWAIGLMLAGITITAWQKGPNWLLVVLCVALILVLADFLVVFTYLAFKSPDLLRTEDFSLSQMAIAQSSPNSSSSDLPETLRAIAGSNAPYHLVQLDSNNRSQNAP